MGLTGGCKNMFGAIPGTDKPEYHYRYPNSTDFSRMLVDINAYFKPVLTICDGIMAMEGNGPSMGKNASSKEGAQSLLGALTQHKETGSIANQIKNADDTDGSNPI